MDHLFTGIREAHKILSETGGADAARAIMTTDSVPKTATFEAGAGWRIGGMAKGAGMLAPGLATMLVVITTDAVLAQKDADAALRAATRVSFDRIDSDGCMSTNDTVLLLASGAANQTPQISEFTDALTQVCSDLARQLIADAEGSTKDIKIVVTSAASEEEAVEVARTVSRSNLLKCAIHGEDPNWGRVLSAVGTTAATFEPDGIDVDFNGVAVCRSGAALPNEPEVDLTNRVLKLMLR